MEYIERSMVSGSQHHPVQSQEVSKRPSTPSLSWDNQKLPGPPIMPGLKVFEGALIPQCDPESESDYVTPVVVYEVC